MIMNVLKVGRLKMNSAAKNWPVSVADMASRFNYVHVKKVHWGDMDALGHVNNVVYFQYLEQSRLGMMEHLGIFPRLFDEQVGLVIADARCRYKAPVIYPDTLHIGLRVDLKAADRMVIHYQLFSEKLGRVVAEAETLQFTVSPTTGRPVDMPDWFRQALQSVQ